jgi:metal-responsive CopG/Arc/MetJ family transcriptional regulator
LASAKISILIDESLLSRLDRLIREQRFASRSQAIQDALSDKLDCVERKRLARECARLDPAFEIELAEEGMAEDFEQWPDF